jgi:hypothetical protein
MQHELAALGRGHGRGDRDLATEFVRSAGLALADAFDLGRVQRIDLGAALVVILEADAEREIKQRAAVALQRGIAVDPAADVANDAAETGAQELELGFGLVRPPLAAQPSVPGYRSITMQRRPWTTSGNEPTGAVVLRPATESSWIGGYKLLDQILLIDRERDVGPVRFPVAARPA